LNATDDADKWCENAVVMAGLLGLVGLIYIVEALVAGGVFCARVKYGNLALEADCSATHERDFVGETGLVDGKAAVEVVAAVNQDVCFVCCVAELVLVRAIAYCFNLDFRVER